MDYEKTFKIESLNEFSRNVYNRVLRYIVNEQIDKRNKNDVYAVLLTQLKGMLQMNLFELSLSDLAKVDSYWDTMDMYTKVITNQKRVVEPTSNSFADYTEQQYSLILEDTLEVLTLAKVPSESPKAFLLGGQPGAGKTTLRYATMKEMGTNVIVVDNDSFKQAHPNFAEIVEQYGKEYISHVTPFSNRLTEDVVEYLSDRKYHLIVEGTLRTVEVPTMTANLLKAKGYEVSLYIIAVSKKLSYLGTLARYEYQFSKEAATARETKKAHHDLVVQNLAENVSNLHKGSVFKAIKLFDRQIKPLYVFEQTSLMNPKECLEPILSGEVKANTLLAQVEKTMQLMEKNGHQKAENYKKLVTRYNSLKKLFKENE